MYGRSVAVENGSAGRVSVVVPAFNESCHIAANMRETIGVLNDFGIDFELIIVDDGSSDDTYSEAKRVLREDPERVRVMRCDANSGKGNALRVGSAAAAGELVVFLDADMDLHPRQLPVLFQTMRLLDADAVIGSKWHPGSRVTYPRVRRLYSKLYFALTRILFGLPVRDTQTGLKLFKTALLDDIFPRVCVKRFAFDVELLAVALRRGYRIADAPVVLEFRRGLGRLNLRTVWNVLLDTLAIFYRMRVLHYYDREDLGSALCQRVAPVQRVKVRI